MASYLFSLSKGRLLLKERIFLLKKTILSFKSWPPLSKETKIKIGSVACSESLPIYHMEGLFLL